MYDPREPHLTATKQILRYLQGTLDHGLLLCYLQCTLNHSLLLSHAPSSELFIYTNANWADCLDTCRSTSGYAVFLGDNLVSRSSKCQNIVSRFSAEAEYCVVANGVAEACWLCELL
jgi:hypothetical protein